MKIWKLAGFYLLSSVFLLASFFLTVNEQWQERQEVWLKERAQQQLRLFVQTLETYHHRLWKNLSRTGSKRNYIGLLSDSDWQSLPDVALMAGWDFPGEGSGSFSLRWKEVSPLLNKDRSHFALTFKKSDWTEIRLEQLLNEKAHIATKASTASKTSKTSKASKTSRTSRTGFSSLIKYTSTQDSQGNHHSILLLSIKPHFKLPHLTGQQTKNLNLLVLLRPHFLQTLINSQKGLRASLGILTQQEGFSIAHETYPMGILPTKHRAVIEKIQKATSPHSAHGFFTNERGEDFFAAYEPIPSTNLYAFWAYALSSLPFYTQNLHWSLYLNLALLALLFIPFFFLLYRLSSSKKGAEIYMLQGRPGSPSSSLSPASSSPPHSPSHSPSRPLSSAPSLSKKEFLRREEESEKRQEEKKKEMLLHFYRCLEKPFKEGLFHIKAHAKALQFKTSVDPLHEGGEILKEARKMSQDLESLSDALGKRDASQDQWLKINHCIEKALEEVFHELERENISLQFNLKASEFWEVKGNDAQLHRAFKALFLKALQAMRTSTTRALRFTSFQEGENACLRMEDQRERESKSNKTPLEGEKMDETGNMEREMERGIGLNFAKEVFKAHKMSLHSYLSKKSGCVLDIWFEMGIMKGGGAPQSEKEDLKEEEDTKETKTENWQNQALSLLNLRKKKP